MKELKTLKDIPKGYEDGLTDWGWIEKKLKAKTIKWVKEDLEEHNVTLYRNLQEDSGERDLILKWMKRLDITEEDLK